MKMHEFGRENKKTILMLHGAGCTYKMWTPQIKELKKSFHLYVPSMSGHEQGDIDFVSSDREADIILEWFGQHRIDCIDVICGASLGAHVAASIMQKAPHFAEYALIESLKGYQYRGFVLKRFCSIGAYVMRKCAAVKGDMAGCYHQKHASDDCKATISNMSEISLLNIMHETGNYLIREGSEKIETKTWILYGEKEKRECIKNTSRLKKQIRDCRVVEIPGYHHGELAIGNSKEHLKMLKRLLFKRGISGFKGKDIGTKNKS